MDYKITVREIEESDKRLLEATTIYSEHGGLGNVGGDCIMIQLDSSIETHKLVKTLSPFIGEVQEVIHYRKKEGMFYRTIIKGKSGCPVIFVIGGFGSGFKGTGPVEFYDYLVSIGVDENEAEKLFDSSYKNAEIIIQKQ